MCVYLHSMDIIALLSNHKFHLLKTPNTQLLNSRCTLMILSHCKILPPKVKPDDRINGIVFLQKAINQAFKWCVSPTPKMSLKRKCVIWFLSLQLGLPRLFGQCYTEDHASDSNCLSVKNFVEVTCTLSKLIWYIIPEWFLMVSVQILFYRTHNIMYYAANNHIKCKIIWHICTWTQICLEHWQWHMLNVVLFKMHLFLSIIVILSMNVILL